MAKNFAAQVREFAEKAKRRQQEIFQRSATALMDEAGTPKGQGGKMPVDTSFLRNSAVASTSGIPGSGDPGYAAVFAGLEVGQTAWAGWYAVYALRMEHGFVGKDSLGREYNQQGNGFMRSAQQNWAFIVQRVAQEVKGQIP